MLTISVSDQNSIIMVIVMEVRGFCLIHFLLHRDMVKSLSVTIPIFLKKYFKGIFINLRRKIKKKFFLAALDLRCCTQAFSSFCEAGASHCGGFSCCKAQALGA